MFPARFRSAFVFALILTLSSAAVCEEVEAQPEPKTTAMLEEPEADTTAGPAVEPAAEPAVESPAEASAEPTSDAPVQTLVTTQAEDALRKALTGATESAGGPDAPAAPAAVPVAQVNEAAQIDAALARLERTRNQLMALIPNSETQPFQILAGAIFVTGDSGRWWQFFPVETVREDLEDMSNRISRGADMAAARDLVGALAQGLSNMAGAYRTDHRHTREQARADALAQIRKSRDYSIQEIDRIRARLLRRRDAI